MHIKVGSGTGVGSTQLAAFDAALFDAGVANFNLIYLSSVIPPESRIQTFDQKLDGIDGEWGDRLYVVMAEFRQSHVGKEAWAGIGWVQDIETGKGLFVEHEGADEEELRQEIESSLKALVETRGGGFGKINMKVAGIRCRDEPVCALVTAVYKSEGWVS